MSMRCNLLGHSYGDEEARTSSDDGEAGDIEVHKRVQVCERCDHEKVVSENKSVRVSQDTSEDNGATVSEPAAADGGTNEGNLEHGYDYDTNDAIILGEDDYPDGTESGAGDETEDTSVDEDASTPGTPVQPENGVAFIDSGPSTPASEDNPEASEQNAPSEPTDDDPDTPTTTDGAAIITSGPGSTDEGEAESVTDVEEADATLEPTADAEVDAPEEATVVSGGGDAIVWSGDTSSSDAVQTQTSADDAGTGTDDEPQSRRERLQSRQSDRESSRLIREGGKDVTCPDCSFRKNQYAANMVAGDACPACRGAYLDWAEDSE